jgi:aminoglycoside phosphotransferase (APT) family kinase protein
VELQADAGVAPDGRDFGEYQSLVLFDGWDHVWRDAAAADARLSARLRDWLRPSHGYRLPARDFAHNDLNLTNVLTDGERITGVVDWDEFGLNTRAVDLAAIAFDLERLALADESTVEDVLGRIVGVSGEDGARCAVTYRAIALVAALARRGEPVEAASAATNRILDRLGAA